ncbi:MAG: LON peptidase substrate-binding domain-containing protein [Proteobacteria bacterium]|nr:LON peptidase substrate-binding domain-containing protein [Pseudomonadota bacterium]
MEIPLFPLSSVLLPYGQVPLQIFEQRYLDLVRSCMKSDSGFGVVWIRSGSEVAGTSNYSLELGKYGTYARIVDWNQLPNGLLGVTIEGREVFALGDTRTSDSSQMYGEANFRPQREPAALIPGWSQLADVLRGLETHPHVQRMNLDIDYDNAWQVGYTLIQLLPLEEHVKYELLGAESLEVMMDALDSTLNEISG